MILESLNILNFKSIKESSCHFADKLNCFIGDNGMGKTNLLDSIHYLSVLRSHTGSRDGDVINFDQDETLIQGRYRDDDSHLEDYIVRLRRNQNKLVSKNGKAYTRLSDHIGQIPIVIVSPQDYILIRGGSIERRKFVDRLLSQNDTAYINELMKYNNALSQRNIMLKSGQVEPDMADYLELILSQAGQFISNTRHEFVKQFTPIFNETYNYLSGSQEVVTLEYTSNVPTDPEQTLKVLKSSRNYDCITGYTSNGIHKDDLEMLIGERLMRKSGSEGQNKTYLIALKFAEYYYQKKFSNYHTNPILLLDDLFDKLDSKRVGKIVELVSGEDFGQIFITDTNRSYLDSIIQSKGTDHKLFRVSDGSVREVL